MTSETPLWDLSSNHEMLSRHVEVRDRRVVDVGAGAGELVRYIRQQGGDPIGVECGEAMISQALEADPEHADAYVDGVGQDLPIDDASADVVVFSYSLHHVPTEHMPAALAEAARVLRTGGTLAVLEPIAEGPGFETHRLVDDETVVRAAAQRALDEMLPESLSPVEEVRYTTSYAYADFDELENTMINIDPVRRETFGNVKSEIARRFEANSVAHDGKYWFAQPVVMRVFAKG